jgi:hypothetical protein
MDLLFKTREAVSAPKLWELATPNPSTIEKTRLNPMPRRES